MADKSTIRIQPDQRQLRGLYKSLNAMDTDSKTKLKNDVSLISAWTAQGLLYSSYNSPMPAQAAVVAKTVKFNRDRIPNVTIGGSRGRTSGGANAGVLVIGNEFGANPTSVNGAFPNGGRRFPFRSPSQGRGNTGYWIFPALKEMQPEITRRWKQAVTEVLSNWNKGEGGGVG